MLIQPGMWLNEPTAIIGSGGSLLGRDWSRFARDWRGRTIAVSRAGLELPADVSVHLWLSIDRTFWEGGRRQRPGAVRVWVNDGSPPLAAGLVDAEIPRRGEGWAEGAAGGSYAVSCAGNSGYAALALTYALGSDPVYLFGFDCAPGAWASEPGHPPNECVFDRWMAASLRLAAEFAAAGRRVYWIGSGAAAPEERMYEQEA